MPQHLNHNNIKCLESTAIADIVATGCHGDGTNQSLGAEDRVKLTYILRSIHYPSLPLAVNDWSTRTVDSV